jgi:hypothetical protein
VVKGKVEREGVKGEGVKGEGVKGEVVKGEVVKRGRSMDRGRGAAAGRPLEVG